MSEIIFDTSRLLKTYLPGEILPPKFTIGQKVQVYPVPIDHMSLYGLIVGIKVSFDSDDNPYWEYLFCADGSGFLEAFYYSDDQLIIAKNSE